MKPFKTILVQIWTGITTIGGLSGFFYRIFSLWNDMEKNLTLWSFSLHCLCASQVPFDAVQWMNRLGKPPRACYSGNTYPGLNLKTRPVLKGLKNNGGALNCDYPRWAMKKLYLSCTSFFFPPKTCISRPYCMSFGLFFSNFQRTLETRFCTPMRRVKCWKVGGCGITFKLI